ncbi:MAG TPA: hypothetical protein VGL00_02275 [Terracidiphilus sp.]
MRQTTSPLNQRLTVLVVRGFIALTLMLVLNSRCFAADNDGCSNATLRGDYGFTILGDQPNPDGTTSPVVGVAITHFDGAGKLTQKDFAVTGGLPLPANGNAATGFHFAGGETGKYSVNSDCTGSAEIDLNAPAPAGLSKGVIKLMFIVPPDGARIHTVVSEFTAPFTTAPLLNTTRSDASRIGMIDGHCSNATLKGDFGGTVLATSPNPDGTISPLKGLAIAEFDGHGSFTQRDFVMTGGLPEPGTGDAQTGFSFSNGQTGTYTVNPDCTGSGELHLNVPAPSGLSSGVIKLMFIVTDDGRASHAVVSEFIPPFGTGPQLNTTRSDSWKLGSE